MAIFPVAELAGSPLCPDWFLPPLHSGHEHGSLMRESRADSFTRRILTQF